MNWATVFLLLYLCIHLFMFQTWIVLYMVHALHYFSHNNTSFEETSVRKSEMMNDIVQKTLTVKLNNYNSISRST